MCLTFALLTPNPIGNTFVPWVDHMHDMVTLGGKANTKSPGTILSTDGWTDNLIPVTPSPQLVAGSIIMIQGSLLIPNIHLLSH